LAAGPVSKMALKQEKAYCVLRFEVSRSVITFSLGHTVRQILHRAISFFGGSLKTAFMYHQWLHPSMKFVILYRMHCRPLERTCYTWSGMSLITALMCVVWPRMYILKDYNYQMRNLESCRCWRCMLCTCKMRNTILIHI
jgi:hypothetical protein